MGFSNSALAKSLIPLIQTQQLWDFIDSKGDEIAREYWKNVYPHFYSLNLDEKIFGLRKLIEHKRFFSAINICSHFVEDIPSEMLVEILQKAATEKSDEQIRLDDYHVNRFFETIHKRNDIDSNTLIQLEWWYMPILASHYNNNGTKRLHEELARNPVFFMDILKWIYRPDDETDVENQTNELNSEQVQNRARQAFDLLHSWKTIPGVDNTGKIDYEFLKSWVNNVRELAAEYGRLVAADSYIGQVLAQYPEEQNKIWPPGEICDLIESLNSDSIKNNFSATTFNKRGLSSRDAFDGGDIERIKADYFHKLASAHQNKYPTITTIFERLAKGYEDDARRADEQAARELLEY